MSIVESVISLPWRPYGICYNAAFAQDSRIAVSSFEIAEQNFIRVYRVIGCSYTLEAEMKVPFPQTRLIFNPNPITGEPDFFVSSGEIIRVLHPTSDGIQIDREITVNTTGDPITCVDWSEYQENLLIAGSTDNTASAVDLNTGDIIAQLIAHDNPIHDISFCGGPSTFITSSIDGSIRFFDLRDTESSIIYYKTSMPILRSIANPSEPNKIAAITKKSNSVTIIDTRRPGIPFAFAAQHPGQVSWVQWSRIVQGSLYSSDSTGRFLRTVVTEEPHEIDTESFNYCTEGEQMIQSFSIGQSVAAIATNTSLNIIRLPSPEIVLGMDM